MIAADHENTLLETADTILADIHHLDLPALGFCILGIHTEKFSSKKGCLITTCTGSDLYDNVLLIHWILRDQKDFQLLFNLCDVGLCFRKLFLKHFLHLFIVFHLKHLQAVFDGLLCILIFCILLYKGLQITLLLHQLAEMLLIIDNVRII